MDMNINISAH